MSDREVTLTADPADILPLIKQFLYAERDVFLRELVSNSLDALTRIDKTYRFSPGFTEDHEPLRVEIQLDLVNHRLSISDNGDGMSEEEVVCNINKIAFSGARKFVDNNLHREERMIGYFGVGFYSSFMVSCRVEIDSWSWRPDAGGCHWVSEGDIHAKLSAPQRRSHGTTVTCHLTPDADEFLNPDRLEKIIRRYLDFAPYPVFMSGRQVNLVTAPWHLSKPEREVLPRTRFIELFDRFNPGENHPMTWFEAEADLPVELRALFFVPSRDGDQQGKVRLYSNRIFICDHVDELFPSWLSFLDGVVDLVGLPINVSRERFHRDSRTRQVSKFLTTKAVEAIGRISRERYKEYLSLWERYGFLLKQGYLISTLQNPDTHLSTKLEELLLFTTSRRSWVRLSEYQERQPEAAKQTFLYLTDERTQSAHLELWRNRNREVLFFTHPLDAVLVGAFKKVHPDWDFLRVDESRGEEPAPESTESTDKSVDESIGESPPPKGTKAVDKSADDLMDLMRKISGGVVGKITIDTLPSRDIPAVLRLDQEGVERDTFRKWVLNEKSEAPSRELVLNAKSPLIQKLSELSHQGLPNELVVGLAMQLWDNVQLNAGLLSEDELMQLARRNAEFLTLVARELLSVPQKTGT